MHRSLVTMIALCALLTQAVLGVGSGAVLCIKGSAGPCGVAPTPSECSCRCAEKAAPPRTVMQLCTPCHDECNDCVEVGLPNETLLAIANTVELPADVFLGLTAHVEYGNSAPAVTAPVNAYGAGPPDRSPRPGALTIRTTILLL